MREAPLRLKLNFIPLLTFTHLYSPLLIYLHAAKLFM